MVAQALFAKSKVYIVIPLIVTGVIILTVLHTNPTQEDTTPRIESRAFLSNSSFTSTSESVPVLENEENNTQQFERSAPLCADMGADLQLFIAITSSPNHSEARMAIRETWGHYTVRKDVKIAFLLGTTDNDQTEANLAEENDLYNDLIRGDFVDSYSNLTLKTMFMLKWVSENCPFAAFLLKTDDDMFINVRKLLSYSETLSVTDRTLYGYLLKKRKPFRNVTHKYYVSKKQYEPELYPDFLTGPAYLIPVSVTKEMYNASQNYPYFHLEDVFMTGIVAHDLNITRVQGPGFINRKVAWNVCKIKNSISFHKITYVQQFDMWKMLHADSSKCKS